MRMNTRSPAEITIVPLGGLGAIGMNCLAIEQADGILVIDCGISFPQEDLGIDTYHPLFRYLEEHRARVAGVFLTHGHEDHVGALPYLLRRMALPVWGPPHALAVARRRLEDRGLDPDQHRLVTAAPGSHYAVGPFDVEPIRVTHSIVDATALAIRTACGIVVHTGDFKFDENPPDGEKTDEARLRQLAEQGVRLLLSDSTNVDACVPPGSESDVGAALEEIVRAERGRVVIGMFASNVLRLKMIGEFSRRLGRRILLLGRSMRVSAELAHRIGRLAWPSDLLVGPDQAAGLLPGRLLVLAGGTQAEPESALRKLASRTHPGLSLTPGDAVVFSSRVIPGNEPRVLAMMGDFLRQGITVRSWTTDPRVHVSGHAHREEQVRMIRLVRPRSFIPLHGTRHHLARHAVLARDCSVPEVLVLENGNVGLVDQRGLSLGGNVPAGRVATWNGAELAESVLQERRSLARGGSLHVALVVDAAGRLVSGPVICGRGVADGEQDPDAFRSVAAEVARACARADDGADDATLRETARLAARQAIFAQTGRRPVTLVSVTRL